MPIGSAVVTKYLKNLIAKQVEDHRLVVWYDPERWYVDSIADLELPDTAVVRYDGSFFQLRHDIDHLLNGEQPPRLVVYVTEERSRLGQHAEVRRRASLVWAG